VKHACLCCGYRTLDERPPGTFAICEVCGWEDDNLQADDPNREGGANRMSLRIARSNFRAYRSREPAPSMPRRSPRDDEGPPLEVDVLAGREVTQVRVDYNVWLLAEGDLLQMNSVLTYLEPGRSEIEIDVERRPQEAAVLLGRLHRGVSAGLYRDRLLRLIFEDDVQLTVPASDRYESWDLIREDGSRVICVPGGELAIWEPTRPVDS